MTRWGVVGCGWVARDHALPGLLAGGHEVVAVHDRSETAVAAWLSAHRGLTAARAATSEALQDPRGLPLVDDPSGSSLGRSAALTTAAEPLACDSLDALLATPGLQAVYVATPNAAHVEAVLACAGAGVPVLCEKPLAADVRDAERMVEACGTAGVLLGTAYDQRWHPAHERLRELLPSLGVVTAVRIVYCCWLDAGWRPPGAPADQANWRADAAVAGGGAAIDLAPHGIDLVGALLGEDLVELHAVLQRRVQDYAVDDGALLHGRTASGVLVDLHVAYNTPDALPRRRLEVAGTRGLAVATDTMGQDAGGSLVVHAPDPVPVPFGDDSPFTRQMSAFSAAVDGRQAWPYAADRDLALHRLLLDALAGVSPGAGDGRSRA